MEKEKNKKTLFKWADVAVMGVLMLAPALFWMIFIAAPSTFALMNVYAFSCFCPMMLLLYATLVIAARKLEQKKTR
jgi:hypothetical protein